MPGLEISSEYGNIVGLNPYNSVDCVIYGFDKTGLKVLLIERSFGNLDVEFDDDLALPGDLCGFDELLDNAAIRILYELTGLKDIFLEQVHTFSNPSRVSKPKDKIWLNAIREVPEVRVITTAYMALINLEAYKATPSGFAKKADWHLIEEIPTLAFDHNEIVDHCIKVLRNKIYREPIGFNLMPKKFSLSMLQNLYERILGKKIDKRNFRRKMIGSGFLIQLEEWQSNVAHKPAQLYSFDENKFESSKIPFNAIN